MIPNKNCNNYKPIFGTSVQADGTANRLRYDDGTLVRKCNNFKPSTSCVSGCQMCINNKVNENISVLSSN